jgi:4-amino-4-deoxy-L-arabinose transferase-like glycosyltransferase
MIEKQTSSSPVQGAKEFLRQRWHLLLLGLLIAAQVAVNWAWLSTNLVLLGWDRPRHLIESLVYNDLLEYVSLRSLFEAWVHSGYYPPLFHWAMVAFYRLFGISMDVAASVNTVFLIVLLVAAYGVGCRIGGKGVGLLAAFFASTSPMVFAMSRYTYIEFSLTAMVALSVWLLLLSEGFSSKLYSLLFGLSAGLGLLTKWTFVLFVFPALLVVFLRAGVLSHARDRLRSLRLDRKWMVVAAAAGIVLTLIWYLPNFDRTAELPLGHLLAPISWFLLGGMIYLLRQPSSRGWNAVASLWLCLVVAGSWYIPRIDFVSQTFLIAWGRPQRQSWAFGYYLDHLTNEHLSLIYMVLVVLASIGLLALAWRALRRGRARQQVWRSDFLLFFLWIVVPYLVFSFRPSSKHSRFILPILPALGVLVAYALTRIRFQKARLASVALVALLGTTQWLALSFDGLQWVRDAAVVGPVNFFAHQFQNQLPSRGDTDRRFWVVPNILGYLSGQAEARGQSVELALLVNTRQVHDEHFLYLIYTDYPNVSLRELAQNWTGRPAYPQLFEVDYVAVPSANPDHKLDAESLEVVDMLLQRPPALFQEAFRRVKQYTLPDGNIIYLYERTYQLPQGYEDEQYEALGNELAGLLGDNYTLVLYPPHEVALLGRYYEGRPHLLLLDESQGADEATLVQTVHEAIAEHGRVATVFESGQGDDKQSVVGRWLSENCFPATNAWYGPAQLTLYSCVPSAAGIGLSGTPVADFGGQVSMLGHAPVPERIVAGEILPLTFVWQAQAEVSSDYKVFVHLLDGEGRIVAQRDSEPVGGWRPTPSWRVGESVRDNHGLLIPESVPAGEYRLIVGLYGPEGERLPVRDTTGQLVGDSLSLGAVQVLAPCHCDVTPDATERLKYEEAASDELAWEDE